MADRRQTPSDIGGQTPVAHDQAQVDLPGAGPALPLRRALHHPLGIVGAFGATAALGAAANAADLQPVIPFTQAYWLALALAMALLYVLALLRLRRGEPATRRRIGWLDEAALARSPQHQPSALDVAAARRRRGEEALAEGDLDRAEMLLRQAQGQFHEVGNRLDEVRVLRALASISRRRGAWIQARSRLERARRALEGASVPYLEAELMLDIAELDLARGDDQAARLSRRASATLIEQAIAAFAARLSGCRREPALGGREAVERVVDVRIDAALARNEERPPQPPELADSEEVDRAVEERIAAARARNEERPAPQPVVEGNPGSLGVPVRRPAGPRAA